MIFGLGRSQKILKTLLVFCTGLDCLWSFTDFFFFPLWTALCFLAKVNGSERDWIVLADVKLLGRVGFLNLFLVGFLFCFSEKVKRMRKYIQLSNKIVCDKDRVFLLFLLSPGMKAKEMKTKPFIHLKCPWTTVGSDFS